jgi:hypothetical protein
MFSCGLRAPRLLPGLLAGLVLLVAQGAWAAAPAELAAPAGTQVAAILSASGVQVYTCELDAHHHLAWVFNSPAATLYDNAGQATVQHAAGPSWQTEDGTRIVGRVLAQAPSATPASIPQLLLQTQTSAGAGWLGAVRYVQRLDTRGGLAPPGQCSREHQRGSSPYLAHYVFLK